MQRSRFYYHRPQDLGITALETKIVVLVVGVMSAIAIPSFLSWYQVKQVDAAITYLQFALQDTQNEAIKQSRTCTLTIPNTPEPTITGTCMKDGAYTLRGVNLSHNKGTDWTITFDFKGRNHNFDDKGTMVFSVPSHPAKAKCITIAIGIGLSRSGNYTGDLADPIEGEKCITS